MAATSSAALFSVLPLPTATPVSARAGSSLCRPTRSAAAVSPIRCSAASPDLSPGAPAPAPPKPQIELEFVGPKPGADGSYPVDRAAAVSGDKLLRDVMLENKLELYAAYVREADELRRRGQLRHLPRRECEPCAQIIDGKELLSPRTDAENRYLKKRICQLTVHSASRCLCQKPESWRLTCQTIVGNKENSGKA
ncbi:unnamed protein product [Triticum turgidum subsp. durum]|uniref:Uncharacterized protein n=1 Tax=Triticum turgidum subsp. durum TaxID=4567 RepID=A0A9R0R3U3_TRITD|nr:unnamed protein product [Triticum turgidum subsp. durum]